MTESDLPFIDIKLIEALVSKWPQLVHSAPEESLASINFYRGQQSVVQQIYEWHLEQQTESLGSDTKPVKKDLRDIYRDSRRRRP